MTRLSKTLFVTAALLAAPVSSALAQDAPTDGEQPVGGEGGDGMGGDGMGGEGEAAPADASQPAPDTGMAPATTGSPLLLGKGKIRITGQTVNIGLFPDNAGKPISLSPAVYYGVSDKLTVGLTHDRGTTWLTPRPSVGITIIDVGGFPVPSLQGPGICVTGEDGGCGKVYNNIGVDALFGVSQDAKMGLAVHGGLDVNAFDPFVLALRAGVLGQYVVNDKISVAFDPRINVGVTERDFGNKESIDIPLWLWFKATNQVSAYVHSGFASTFEDFGDNVAIPLGLGVNFAATEKLTVGADFHFLDLEDSADAKMLGLRAIFDI